jgi:hypothetical protein
MDDSQKIRVALWVLEEKVNRHDRAFLQVAQVLDMVQTELTRLQELTKTYGEVLKRMDQRQKRHGAVSIFPDEGPTEGPVSPGGLYLPGR